MTISDEWHQCYGESWKGVIVADAFQHPAKISRALVRRIYSHAFEHGWLRIGDTVVDCFGGIAGTAIDAVVLGCHWRGVELEQKFVALAQANIGKWRRWWGHGYGTARIIQGDSRKLSSILDNAGIVVSSPPFMEQQTGRGIAKKSGTDGNVRIGSTCGYVGQGESEGNLSNMPPGDVAAIVSSPPYSGIAAGAGGLNTKPGSNGQQSGRSAQASSQIADQRYGNSAGQLATMREGEVAAVVSSPPFLSEQRGGGIVARDGANGDVRLGVNCGYQNQSTSEGNLASTECQATFWQAAGDIVAECHKILRPGGMAIWVVKDFVRAGKRMPFCDQWQALCESRGFVLECRHHAMLVEHGGTQGGLFGPDKLLKRERKSFFRRLHEAKPGAVQIDWEDVICVRKV